MNAIVEKSYDLSNIDDKKACCDNPQIYTTLEGCVVCRHCGLTFGSEMVETERRMYSIDEIKKKRQTEVPWTRLANRTFFDNNYNSNFYRMSKINRYITGLERSQIEGQKGLKRIARAMNLAPWMEGTALIIIKRSMQKRLARGRSISNLATACILLASRIHRTTIMIDDVLNVIPGLSRHLIMVSIRLIKENVLPALGFNIKSARDDEIHGLIMKFGTVLEISTRIQLKAVSMYKSACVAGYGKITIGKDPRSIAASFLYLSTKNLTQEKVSKACGTTSTTLRNHLKQIKPFLEEYEKIKKAERIEKYRREHPEIIPKCRQNYYTNHREQENKRTHEHYVKHRENYAKRTHEYYTQHKEKIYEQKKQLRALNRDKINARRREHYAEQKKEKSE